MTGMSQDNCADPCGRCGLLHGMQDSSRRIWAMRYCRRSALNRRTTCKHQAVPRDRPSLDRPRDGEGSVKRASRAVADGCRQIALPARDFQMRRTIWRSLCKFRTSHFLGQPLRPRHDGLRLCVDRKW